MRREEPEQSQCQPHFRPKSACGIDRHPIVFGVGVSCRYPIESSANACCGHRIKPEPARGCNWLTVENPVSTRLLTFFRASCGLIESREPIDFPFFSPFPWPQNWLDRLRRTTVDTREPESCFPCASQFGYWEALKVLISPTSWISLATPARFERATPRLGIWCSILLSYGVLPPLFYHRSGPRKQSQIPVDCSPGRPV